MVAAYDRALCPQECMQLYTVWTAKIAAHPTFDIPCTLGIDDGDNIMEQTAELRAHRL